MDILKLLSSLPAFKGLDEEELAEILFSPSAKAKKHKKGELVKMQGDECRGLYVLCQGTVRCTMGGSEGKTITVELLTAPALVAPAFIFATDNHFPVTVWAEEDCHIICVGRDHLVRHMTHNTQFTENMMRVISNRCAFLSKRLNDFAVNSLKQRILNFIETNGPIENLSEAARHLGVARPSLSRAMSEMEREGILQR